MARPELGFVPLPSLGHTPSPSRPQTRRRAFGWIKTIAGGHPLRHRKRQPNRAWFLITAASYNLVRSARLDTPAA